MKAPRVLEGGTRPIYYGLQSSCRSLYTTAKKSTTGRCCFINLGLHKKLGVFSSCAIMTQVEEGRPHTTCDTLDLLPTINAAWREKEDKFRVGCIWYASRETGCTLVSLHLLPSVYLDRTSVPSASSWISTCYRVYLWSSSYRIRAIHIWWMIWELKMNEMDSVDNPHESSCITNGFIIPT